MISSPGQIIFEMSMSLAGNFFGTVKLYMVQVDACLDSRVACTLIGKISRRLRHRVDSMKGTRTYCTDDAIHSSNNKRNESWNASLDSFRARQDSQMNDAKLG